MKTHDILHTLTSSASRAALAAGLAGALGFAAPAVSFAQERGPTAERGEHEHGRFERGRHGHRRGHRGRHHLLRMADELSLTDAQREQIRGIMRDARGQRGEGDHRARRRQVSERIQAVLTAEQRQRAEELRAEHGRQRIERRLGRMTERLSLDDRQQQQVRGILRNAAMQRRVLFEQAETDRASAREAMRALHERTAAAIRSVLTTEQQSSFDEMPQRRRGRGHR